MHSISIAAASFSLATQALLAQAYIPPQELFSPLIFQKALRVASNFSSPTLYPQYTDVSGEWLYFKLNTWTTGFFPSLLYALDERVAMCSNSTLNPANTPDGTDWLSLARMWSAPETGMERTNTLGHDVGFVSFPFQDELKV